MSKLQVGSTFEHAGFRYSVIGCGLDGSVPVFAVRIDSKVPPAAPAQTKGQRPAPGVAAGLVEGTLEPLTAARTLGFIDGFEGAADFCAMHADTSGRTLASKLRDEAERHRKAKHKS